MNKPITAGTYLKDLRIIQNETFFDKRGFLVEHYSKKQLEDLTFVQDNLVFSKKNTIRGLHFQKVSPQGKLITVCYGCIYDVCVDLRPESITYSKWFSIVLSEDFTQIYIPEGFAHGFLALTDSLIIYKCTNLYDPNDQHGYIWNDETINIDWNIEDENIIISDKDKILPKFKR